MPRVIRRCRESYSGEKLSDGAPNKAFAIGRCVTGILQENGGSLLNNPKQGKIKIRLR